MTTLFPLVAMVAAVHPVAAQTVCDSACTQFIANVEASIGSLTANLPPSNPPIVFGAQEVFAHGALLTNFGPGKTFPASVLLDYADGLKAAGVQRFEFNPSVTSIDVPAVVANLDALVRHIRQLGMQLAINPEYTNAGGVGEFNVATFQDFQTVAMQTYPQLAARYRPENFVIVHEPTTMAARMGIATTPAEWDAFIRAVEPLIKKASPHTQVGAGDCAHCNEDAFFSDFVAIPNCTATTLNSGCLDFMTIDLYSTLFSEVEGWVQAAHANNKGVYMEETFAPTYLPSTLPPDFQSNPAGVEAYALIGGANQIFETMDQDWLLAIAKFASSYGMESITPFTTETFFLYVTSGPDKATDPTYLKEAGAAIQQGQLTATANAYAADASLRGIKTVTSISNASYATLPTVFNPSCGTADNPCNPNSTVAPDMIVSAFGADLANQTIPASAWPTSLGGTKATLVDSTNTSFAVPLYSVAPTQVNYLVPSKAAPGPATLTIKSGDGTATTGIVLVAPVAPGLYTYFANGQGPAAAIAVCTGTCSGWPNKLSNGQFWQYTFVPGCSAEPSPATARCEAPITWGANDSVVIELYGTGIRHLAAASDITASAMTIIPGPGPVGPTISLPVQFAGAQGETGLDQVNVAITPYLNGLYVGANLFLTVQDTVNNVSDTSNVVGICLQSSACGN